MSANIKQRPVASVALFIFLLGVVIAATLSLTGCGEMTATAQAAALADQFKASTEKFDSTRREASEQLAEDTKEAVKQLSEDDPEGASESWESAWSEFAPNITRLEEDLKGARKDAEKYFAALEANTNSIPNPAVKSSEVEKNNRIKELWIRADQDASVKLAELKGVKAEADTFQKILLNEVLRGKIEKNIERLRSITSDAQVILSKLEQLKAKSKEILKS
jgi:hypothetical protein